jgi:hypothetical protein
MNSYQDLENKDQAPAQQENSTSNNGVLEKLNKYFQLVNDFENVKQDLRNHTNGYFDSLMGMIDYKFSNPVKDPNFYHYAAEAWILTILKTLRAILQEDLNQGKDYFSISFNDILEKINKIKLDEDSFIENLETLLGTYKIKDHIIKITQIKMSQIFLKKIELAKEITIQNRINENITKINFEEIIFLILKKALNFTLNELNSREEDKNSLLFLNVFTQLKKISDNENLNLFTLEDYQKELNKLLEKSDTETKNLEVELLNPVSTFYNFSIISFKDLVKEIETFNVNSSNLLKKIKFLVKSNFSRAKHLLKNTYNYINLKSSDYRVFALVNSIIDKTLIKSQSLVQTSKKKYTDVKQWVQTSPTLQNYATVTKNVYSCFNVYYYSMFDRVEKVVLPLKDIIIFYYSKSVRIFVDAKLWTGDKIKNFYTLIKQTTSDVFGEKGKGIGQVFYDSKQKVFQIIIENHEDMVKKYPNIKSVEDWLSFKLNQVQNMAPNVVSNFKKIMGLAPPEPCGDLKCEKAN